MDIQDLLQLEVQRLYDRESQVASALDFLSKRAVSEEVSKALTDLRLESQKHIGRLAEACNKVGSNPVSSPDLVVGRLLLETKQRVWSGRQSAATDLAMIAALQKALHLQVAAYRIVIPLAASQGLKSIKDLLSESLKAVEKADDLLMTLAERQIQEEATMSGQVSMQ